jgi:hypothetical protein
MLEAAEHGEFRQRRHAHGSCEDDGRHDAAHPLRRSRLRDFSHGRLHDRHRGRRLRAGLQGRLRLRRDLRRRSLRLRLRERRDQRPRSREVPGGPGELRRMRLGRVWPMPFPGRPVLRGAVHRRARSARHPDARRRWRLTNEPGPGAASARRSSPRRSRQRSRRASERRCPLRSASARARGRLR